MSGGHYDETFALEDIGKMYYTDTKGNKHQAPYWPSSAVREIYETVKNDIRPYTPCDFDWTERSVPSWSGETGAFLVTGEDGTQEGLFAFWD